jgi:hypothetical protein
VVAKAPAAARTPSFPPRDADGRIATVQSMLAGVGFAMVIGIVLVLAIDGVVTLIGRGSFGSFSGWIAGVLAVWMFVEDFRAWRGVPARILVAIAGVVLAVAFGGALNVILQSLPEVFAGAISVTAAALLYAVIWFFGVRFFADRQPER